LIAFLKTLQKLRQEWQKSPALGPGKPTAKTWFGLENRKKISQIINAYLYLPFFLLIILYISALVRMRHEDLKDADVGEDHDKEGAVEGDSGGEDEVAQVLSKQALPLRRGTCVWSM
jgi:hypothetical protein